MTETNPSSPGHAWAANDGFRILLAVADGKPGGGTTAVLALAEGLRRHGIAVTLATEENSYAERRARSAGIAVETAPFFAGSLNGAHWRRIAQILKRGDFDLVHAHGSRAGTALVPHLLSRRPPFVYTAHGYHFPGKTQPGKALGALAESACHRLAARSIWVATHDRAMARRWRLVGADAPGRVIPNGVDLAALPEPLPPDFTRIAFVGRLHTQKNPLLLAPIMKRLAPHGLHLDVIGGGDLEAVLRSLVNTTGLGGAMHITGVVPREQALDMLRGAACLVMPSRWEGMPLGAIEAMAMGVPVVASDVGGVGEVVVDGITGRLVPAGDSSAFVAAILGITGDPGVQASMALAGRQRIAAHFGEDRMIELHLALYHDILDGAKRSHS